jgi:hypothetical protein
MNIQHHIGILDVYILKIFSEYLDKSSPFPALAVIHTNTHTLSHTQICACVYIHVYIYIYIYIHR